MIELAENAFLVQFLVHKAFFYHSLAVVEYAANLVCSDILAKRGELQFLQFADQSGRVQNVHLYALNAKKSVGYCTSGVA